MKLTIRELGQLIKENDDNIIVEDGFVDTVGMGYARAAVKLRDTLSDIGYRGVAKILVDAFGADEVVDALENMR